MSDKWLKKAVLVASVITGAVLLAIFAPGTELAGWLVFLAFLLALD